MDKKALVAVVLSALILMGYQYFIAVNYNHEAADVVRNAEKKEAITTMIPPERPQPLGAAGDPGDEGDLEAFVKKGVEAEEIVFWGDKYIATVSNIGGYIKSVFLNGYPDPKTGEPYALMEAERGGEGIFLITRIGGDEIQPIPYDVVTREEPLLLKGIAGNAISVTKKYIFSDDAYHVTMELGLENESERTIDTYYEIVASSNIKADNKLDRRYINIVAKAGEDIRRENGKKGEGVYREGDIEYIGLQNKYFSLLCKPGAKTTGARLLRTENDEPLAKIRTSRFTIGPGEKVQHTYLLYLGPNKEDVLKNYNLSGALNRGFLGGISNALLAGLKFFHKITRNYGISIVLLAILVNLLLFPLSRKSYSSMKKMQDLQPHIEELRNTHKDNPQKLNKEMMDLYKRFNVNPLGGCFPLLLQIPVFIALWQALMRSLELRGARFLWIKDLSMPDAVPLPFTAPLIGNSLNILPILMAICTLLQQRVMAQRNKAQSEQARQQQQIMFIMPVVFLFIMYNFPSGLVLYWLTNTLLTMFEQRAIMQR